MTDTRAAFLAAIRERPDDDAIRLIFADWLDENGDPERAEFIRTQIRHGQYSILSVRAAPFGMCDFIADLDGGPVPEWAWRPFLPYCAGQRWGFVRGFVQIASLPAADWLAHADTILAEHPVRTVRLTTWPDIRKWNPDRLITNIDTLRSTFRSTLTSAAYPGVTFELPQASEATFRLTATANYREVLRSHGLRESQT